MRTRVTLLAAMVASLVAIGTASAAPGTEPSVQIVGKVQVNEDGTASVKAHYRCHESADWHLWVSAKQAAGGSQDPALLEEGSGAGQIGAAWLQSHPVTFRCDGEWHTQRFQIDTAEQGYGQLVPGYAYVQLCLINGPQELFFADRGWAKVR